MPIRTSHIPSSCWWLPYWAARLEGKGKGGVPGTPGPHIHSCPPLLFLGSCVGWALPLGDRKKGEARASPARPSPASGGITSSDWAPFVAPALARQPSGRDPEPWLWQHHHPLGAGGGSDFCGCFSLGYSASQLFYHP